MTSAENEPLTTLLVEWDDSRAVALRELMDAEIQQRYAGRHVDPDVLQKALAVDPTSIVATVLVLAAAEPIAHAALRRLGPEWEVKKVIVNAAHRGRGVGRRLMTELEKIARTEAAPRLILQTGDRQPEAVALYRGLGYTPIPVFPPYAGAIPDSLCFEKILGQATT